MLSGEGNENGKKKPKTIGLISQKSKFARAAHFWTHMFCTTTKWNSQKLPRLHVLWRKCRTCSCSLFFFFFFFTAAHFYLGGRLAFLIFSPPLQNFHVFLPTKNVFLCFLSLALALCRSLSRWTSLTCRLLSLFLCLSLYPYSKFVDMTI